MKRTKSTLLAAFLVTWSTATPLLVCLVDYNVYVHYPSGRYFPKYTATWTDRVLYSLLYAGIYSALNTALLFAVAKGRQEKAKQLYGRGEPRHGVRRSGVKESSGPQAAPEERERKGVGGD